MRNAGNGSCLFDSGPTRPVRHSAGFKSATDNRIERVFGKRRIRPPVPRTILRPRSEPFPGDRRPKLCCSTKSCSSSRARPSSRSASTFWSGCSYRRSGGDTPGGRLADCSLRVSSSGGGELAQRRTQHNPSKCASTRRCSTRVNDYAGYSSPLTRGSLAGPVSRGSTAECQRRSRWIADSSFTCTKQRWICTSSDACPSHAAKPAGPLGLHKLGLQSSAAQSWSVSYWSIALCADTDMPVRSSHP